MAKLPSEPTTDHYTAVLEVHRTIGPYQPQNNRGYPEGNVVVKQNFEVARVVVRSNTIEGLKKKITAHTDLIEE